MMHDDNIITLTQPEAPIFRRAKRISDIGLSEIVKITEAVSERIRLGETVVALSTGEPDFDTPAHVIEAANMAASSGDTRYPPTKGNLALRNAIADAASRGASPPVEPNEVVVGTGAKQVLFNAFMATLDFGDEVVVAAPYWTSYVDIVKTAGGIPVVATATATGHRKPGVADLEAAIGPKTRWLLLNSPSNPSGDVYSPNEMTDIATMLRRHPHVWLASDEIYRHICFVPFTSFRDIAPDLVDRILIIDGVSKAYAMTGWRIGWGIGPAPLIEAMAAVQGQSTSGASSISQAAAHAALTGHQELISARLAIYRRRRDRVVSRLNDIEILDCPIPDGAFYVFPSCARAIGLKNRQGTVISNDADFCAHLLETTNVAVVPGAAFGAPGHFRLSFAYADAKLDDGCNRIADACEELS